MPIRVLVIDDSAVVRKVLSEELSRYADIEVVGTAMDPYVARDKIIALRPDVLTLDVEMPRMDGLSFLERLMQHYPLPVVIVSSLTPRHSDAAVRALALGAVAVVPKPGSVYSLPDVEHQLVSAIRAASRARLHKRTAPVAPVAPTPVVAHLRASPRLVAIGASTGGTSAIESILCALPASFPAVVIVQHMPAGFTASFAERLNQHALMTVREARDGDLIEPGLALIAPGNFHLAVESSGTQWIARVKDGPYVHHQRPAVDVLFQSAARAAGRKAIGIVLTGMGEDGARGLLALREAGAWTIAQDEATSVVYGMPRAAFECGAAREVRALGEIAGAIARAVSARSHTPVGNAVSAG